MGNAELISLQEGAKQGIERLRKPAWSDPLDHLKIELVSTGVGDRATLYSPSNAMLYGEDSIKMFCVAPKLDPTVREWLPYGGPLPTSEEYKRATNQYLPPKRLRTT